jgi:hypothetical protein
MNAAQDILQFPGIQVWSDVPSRVTPPTRVLNFPTPGQGPPPNSPTAPAAVLEEARRRDGRAAYGPTPPQSILDSRESGPSSNIGHLTLGKFADIEAAIKASRVLTTHGDNWDGEGASGWTIETWQRATRFLRELSFGGRATTGRLIRSPQITGAETGSIDLYWSGHGRTLLINFPSDPAIGATFYGKDSEGNTMLGEIAASERVRLDLAAWIV